MSNVFDWAVDLAHELIAENGQLITWRRIQETANTSTPWKATVAAPIDVLDVPICFLPIDRESSQLIRYLKGTDLVAGSLYGLMGAVDFEPLAKDVIIRDGKELRITAIDPLAPNGLVILYTIQFDT